MSAPPKQASRRAARLRRRRVPLQLRLLRLAFSGLGPLLPGLMARWMYRLWFRTRRHPQPQREIRWLRDAQRTTLQHRQHAIAVYSWGDGVPVLLIHGWNGRGAQLGALAAPLVKRGCRVIAFDAPAHGESQGRATTLFEIVELIRRLGAEYGPFRAIIGHSFGCVCLLYALQQGVTCNAAACISAPDHFPGLVDKFAAALHIPPAVVDHFNARLNEAFGADTLQRISPLNTVQSAHVPVLFVHDADDHDVPSEESQRLVERAPRAHLILTHHLGHRRILRDAQVIEHVTEFIAEHADV
jgi:pimeloyl-ACP methyl ester carboxylesterase